MDVLLEFALRPRESEQQQQQQQQHDSEQGIGERFVKQSMLVQFVLEASSGRVLVVSRGATKYLSIVPGVHFLSIFQECSVNSWGEVVEKLQTQGEHVSFSAHLDEADEHQWKVEYVRAELQFVDRELVATLLPRYRCLCGNELVHLSPNSIKDYPALEEEEQEDGLFEQEKSSRPARSFPETHGSGGLAMFEPAVSKMQWCDEGFTRLFGVPRENILEHTIQDLLYSEDFYEAVACLDFERTDVFQCETKVGQSRLRLSFLRGKGEPSVAVYAEDISSANHVNKVQELDFEEKLAQIIDHFPAGVLLVDTDNDEKTVANLEFERITGHPRIELTSLNAWFMLLQPEAPAEAREVYEMKRTQGFTSAWTVPFQRQDRVSNLQWLQLHVSDHLDKRQPQIWLVTDVTDHITAKEKFRILFEMSTDAYLICDDEHAVLECNQATVRVLQCKDKSEVIGRRPEDFSPQFQPNGRLSTELATEFGQSAHDSGFARFEWQHLTSKGVIVPVEVSLMSSTILGEKRVILIVWHDLTSVKRQQEELRAAKDVAELASKAKSQFLAKMSHEIRTPMNGVVGVAELLLSTSLSTEQWAYLEIIRSSGNSLMRILSDILDLTKIELKSLDVELVNFDIRRQVAHALALLQVVASEKDLALLSEVDSSVPVYVAGDPIRLRQILLNLISNSIKFTNRGGIVVKVRRPSEADFCKLRAVTPSESENLHQSTTSKQTVLFEIKDSGIGIDSETQGRLFQAFVQGDNTTSRRYGGPGLGLAISKSLVNLMGGAIGIESELGRGSTFFFTISFGVVQESLEVKKDTAATTAGLKDHILFDSKKVLVAEDNRVNQVVVSRMLQNLGAMNVDLVDNGLKAVQACTRKNYSLVLMDCHMPEMDGYEATKRIRAWESEHPGKPPAVIVALTASTLRYEKEKCVQAGMNGYLSKPVRPQDLVTIVRNQLPQQAEASCCSSEIVDVVIKPEEQSYESLLRSGTDLQMAIDAILRQNQIR